jgi:uncharacterized protein with HEPN domain
MPRKLEAYREDIIESIDRIQAYIEGMDFQDFSGDQKTVDAVINNLENIGEAAKNIPQDFKEENDEVEWEDVAGFRDVLVHQYFRADEEIVWDIVKNELSFLKRALEDSE